VIPTLTKILAQIDRVFRILPDHIISSADMSELSTNLRSMRALVQKATVESLPLSDLRQHCTHEWNISVAFCETKLPFLGRMIEAIEAKRASFERDTEKTKTFNVLSAAFNDCEAALGGDFGKFARALRNRQARFSNGQAVLAYAAQGEQLLLLQQTTL
jgi:hypothetical protein